MCVFRGQLKGALENTLSIAIDYGLYGLHISGLDAVNVDLTMAHCYSDLSRLPAKVEKDGRGKGVRESCRPRAHRGS